jgi:membrane protease YdiL (CAAX protease family)
MPSEYLQDLMIVAACSAAAILIARAYRFQGAAALGVAVAALAVIAIQLDRGGLHEIGLLGPPDFKALWPLIAGGLVACYLIAGVTSYGLAQIGLAPDVSRLDFIKGNLPALLLMLAVSWTTAAFGEEIVFRGFLLNRAAGLDVGITNWVLMVIVAQALFFGLAHAYQGLGGMIVTGVLGLALGVLTFLGQGNFWPAILVHGLINTASLTALFFSTPSRSSEV